MYIAYDNIAVVSSKPQWQAYVTYTVTTFINITFASVTSLVEKQRVVLPMYVFLIIWQISMASATTLLNVILLHYIFQKLHYTHDDFKRISFVSLK